MKYEEARALAKSVLSGTPKSYVEASRRLAEFVRDLPDTGYRLEESVTGARKVTLYADGQIRHACEHGPEETSTDKATNKTECTKPGCGTMNGRQRTRCVNCGHLLRHDDPRTSDATLLLDRTHPWAEIVAAAVRFVDDPGEVHGECVADLTRAVRAMQHKAYGLIPPPPVDEWVCPSPCQTRNLGVRSACTHCQAPRPVSADATRTPDTDAKWLPLFDAANEIDREVRGSSMQDWPIFVALRSALAELMTPRRESDKDPNA